MKNFYKTIQELKEFLMEHEEELYSDETKRSLYLDLLEIEAFLDFLTV